MRRLLYIGVFVLGASIALYAQQPIANLTATNSAAGSKVMLDVAVIDGAGAQVTSFGGGTQYTEADTDTTIVGTAIMFENNTGTSALAVVNATTPLPVGGNLLNSMDGTLTDILAAMASDATYDAAAITTGPQMMGAFDDTSTDSVDEGDAGSLRISANRNLFTTIRDAAGNERGANVTAANELLVELGAGSASIGTLGANSGVDIGDVDVLSIVAGTGATNLGKAEDNAHASADTGVAVWAVRDDTLAAYSGAENDYEPFHTNSLGALWTIGDLCGSPSVSTVVIEGSADAELVAISGSTVIYVCGYNFISSGTNNVRLINGTGSVCGTGTDAETGTYQLTAQTGISVPNTGAVQFSTAAGDALCLDVSAAVTVSGLVTYVQR